MCHLTVVVFSSLLSCNHTKLWSGGIHNACKTDNAVADESVGRGGFAVYMCAPVCVCVSVCVSMCAGGKAHASGCAMRTPERG